MPVRTRRVQVARCCVCVRSVDGSVGLRFCYVARVRKIGLWNMACDHARSNFRVCAMYGRLGKCADIQVWFVDGMREKLFGYPYLDLCRLLCVGCSGALVSGGGAVDGSCNGVRGRCLIRRVIGCCRVASSDPGYAV